MKRGNPSAWLTLAFVAGAFASPGCGLGKSGFAVSALSLGGPVGARHLFEAMRQVVDARCVSCHAEYQNMQAASWVSSGLVEPGSLERSRLYGSLKGAETPGPHTMPKDGTLSADELGAFRAFILRYGEAEPGPPPPPPEGPAARYAAAFAILTAKCGACHAQGTPVVRATSAAHAGAIVPRFASFPDEFEFTTPSGLMRPEDPTGSWIYQALRGPGSIGTMPRDAALTAAELATLEEWIRRSGLP